MVRNFRQEAYDLMVAGVSASDAADVGGALHDASERVGKAIKAEYGKASDYELILLRLIRRIREGNWPQAKIAAERAAELLAKHGGSNPLR